MNPVYVSCINIYIQDRDHLEANNFLLEQPAKSGTIHYFYTTHTVYRAWLGEQRERASFCV